VVVENDDRPMFGRQPAESVLEVIPRSDGARHVGVARWLSGKPLDLGRPTALAASFRVAGVDDEAAEPGIEALGLAKGGQIAPRTQQGLLDSVLGSVGVAQDPAGDGVAPGDVRGGQRGERLVIALLRPFDEVELHPAPSVRRPDGRVTDYGAGLSRNVHVTSGQASWR